MVESQKRNVETLFKKQKLISCGSAQFAIGSALIGRMEHVRYSQSFLPVGPVVLLR